MSKVVPSLFGYNTVIRYIPRPLPDTTTRQPRSTERRPGAGLERCGTHRIQRGNDLGEGAGPGDLGLGWIGEDGTSGRHDLGPAPGPGERAEVELDGRD